MFVDHSKGKPINRKTLSYFTFVLDGIALAMGCTYRIVSRNRFCFDLIATIFLLVIVSVYLLGAYFFLVAWVKMAIQSTTSSKTEALETANKICRKLKFQVVVFQTLQRVFWIYLAFISEEVSPTRAIFVKLGNMCTVLLTIAAMSVLVKCGFILAKAVRNAGDDEKLIKLANNMIHMVYGCVLVMGNMVVGLLLLTFVPILISYQVYIFTFVFTVNNIMPISVCALFEKASWLEDYRKRFPGGKVTPNGEKEEKEVRMKNTIVSRVSTASAVQKDDDDEY